MISERISAYCVMIDEYCKDEFKALLDALDKHEDEDLDLREFTTYYVYGGDFPFIEEEVIQGLEKLYDNLCKAFYEKSNVKLNMRIKHRTDKNEGQDYRGVFFYILKEDFENVKNMEDMFFDE